MPLTIDNPLRGGDILTHMEQKKKPIPAGEYLDFYPEGINLTPKTKFHDELRDEILRRARESAEYLKGRHPKWAKIDEMLTAFITQDEQELRKKDNDPRKPVSIVVPELYATLETLLTYMMGVFGSRPLFRYQPTGPEDIISVALLEQQIDVQSEKNNTLLKLYSQWRDGFAYGIGIIHVGWEVRTGSKTVKIDTGEIDATGQDVPFGPVRDTQDTILYEGSTLENIDPRKYLPDPNVEIYNVQDGEYVGWVANDTYINLLRQEQVDGGPLFNVKHLKGTKRNTSIYGPSNGSTSQHPEREADRDDRVRPSNNLTDTVDVVYMYIDLIPEDWGLGSVDTPEKWMFAIANDDVIISAHPMNLDHGMFPVVVCAPDFGGHEIVPISRLEVVFGYQELMNFYNNTHVFEVEKFLKNQLVIDPKLVNQKDVKAQNGVIRTRRPNWGRGVNDAIKELKMQDVTSGYLSDLFTTQSMSRQASGAVDSIQGIQRTGGERVTAEEFRSTRGAALSRLQKAARIISLQSMHPLSIMLAKHTQQFMSESTYLRVSGRWQQSLELEYGIKLQESTRGQDIKHGFMPVTPFDLIVDFDVISQDGSVEGGEFLQDWKELYLMILQNPEATAQIDSTRILLHIARLMNLDSAMEFIKKETPVSVTTLPDDVVENQLNDNQLVPIEEAQF